MSALSRLAPRKSVPVRLASRKMAPSRLASRRSAPATIAFSNRAALRLAPRNLAFCRLPPEKLAGQCLAIDERMLLAICIGEQSAYCRSAPSRRGMVKLTPRQSALVKTASRALQPERSDIANTPVRNEPFIRIEFLRLAA